MKPKNNKRPARKGDALPPEIGLLLHEIEKEPVPERLLVLAQQLQEALARKRREEIKPSRPQHPQGEQALSKQSR